MHVGPRPGADESGETTPGVLVVTPLRLEDLRPRGFFVGFLIIIVTVLDMVIVIIIF